MSVTRACERARRGEARRGEARRGEARRGEARRGETGFGEKDIPVALTALNCNDEWRRLRRDE